MALSDGQSTAAFDNYGIALGTNFLQATFTDATGNIASSVRRTYTADFYGPSITLDARDAGGAPLSCSSGSPCVVDLMPQQPDGRDVPGRDHHLHPRLKDLEDIEGLLVAADLA